MILCPPGPVPPHILYMSSRLEVCSADSIIRVLGLEALLVATSKPDGDAPCGDTFVGEGYGILTQLDEYKARSKFVTI